MSSCKKYKEMSVEDIDNAFRQLDELMGSSSSRRGDNSEVTIVNDQSRNTTVDNDEVAKVIHQYTSVLSETMENFNKTLKKVEFGELLANIYTNLSIQKGGSRQITYDKSHLLTHFKAFAALLSSIVLLYLAFDILNGLTCELTGETILKYPELVFKDVFITAQEMTFLQYVWRSITTLSANVVGQQTEYMTRILQTSMHFVIPDMTAIVNETCMPPTTGLLGNAGRYLAGIMSPQPTSDCIVETSAELARQFLAAQEGKLALLAIQTKASFAQVIILTRLGLGLGAASIGYFATVITLPKSNSRVEAIDEEGRKFLETGGRRKTRRRTNGRKKTRKRNPGPANWKCK